MPPKWSRACARDPRIGPHAYIRAGPAFAGGTLARDVQLPACDSRNEHDLALPLIGRRDREQPGTRALGARAARAALAATRGADASACSGLAYKPGTERAAPLAGSSS